MIANHNMGIQAELLLFPPIGTGFFFFGPAPLSFFLLLLLQRHSFDLDEPPWRRRCPVLPASGWTGSGYGEIETEISSRKDRTLRNSKRVFHHIPLCHLQVSHHVVGRVVKLYLVSHGVLVVSEGPMDS